MIDLAYTAQAPRVPKDNWGPLLQQAFGTTNISLESQIPYVLRIKRGRGVQTVRLSEENHGTRVTVDGPQPFTLIALLLIFALTVASTLGTAVIFWGIVYFVNRARQQGLSGEIVTALSAGAVASPAQPSALPVPPAAVSAQPAAVPAPPTAAPVANDAPATLATESADLAPASSTPKFCPHCGAAVSGGKFCGVCGKGLLLDV
tara:strand:- start:202 stop:813 length:612 start_codon:yes stop_codon:yes gene_type:complete